jgi:hypothetical protein
LDIIDLIKDLIAGAGDLWFIALIGAFFVMICESSKPKPREGEPKAEPQGFALLVMILSLLTPLMLMIHAVATGAGNPIAAIALVGAMIVSAGLIGVLIASVSADFGRTLTRAAPFLALAVFALAAYVTWQSVFGLINSFVVSLFG